MFPRDAITAIQGSAADGNLTVIATSTNTILNLDFQLSAPTANLGTTAANPRLQFYCGSPINNTTKFYDSRGSISHSVPMHYVCTNGAITMNTTGSIATTQGVNMTYVPRDRTLTQDPVLSTTTVQITQASSSITVTGPLSTSETLLIAMIIVGLLGIQVFMRMFGEFIPSKP